METKPLLYGLIGFFIGGFIVSFAATTFEKPAVSHNGTTMTAMANDLKGKKGDDFDKAFITGMIEHHEGAIQMAELADMSAKHKEITQLSKEIISAQEAEIKKMKMWQSEWGYGGAHSTDKTGH